jgi:hypothetical protein
MLFFLIFVQIPKTIDKLLPNIITKDAISVKDRKKFIEEQFMEIKNKVALNANKTIQKHIIDADKVHIDHKFKQNV